jgi:hypothetical protein
MKREIVEEFLASFPFADSTKGTYRRVILKPTAFEIDGWRAADLLRFISKPEWGSTERYNGLCAWSSSHAHPFCCEASPFVDQTFMTGSPGREIASTSRV